MKKKVSFHRSGDTTTCIVQFANGQAHAASAKHPNEKLARQLVHRNLQNYVKVFPLDFQRASNADTEKLAREISERRGIQDVRVEIDGE